MYNKEFPALALVTNNMDARLVYEVGQNLASYNTDVRIDYERWVCFETEYGEWSERTYADAKDGIESWEYQTAQR
jgi:hypothetical protein